MLGRTFVTCVTISCICGIIMSCFDYIINVKKKLLHKILQWFWPKLHDFVKLKWYNGDCVAAQWDGLFSNMLQRRHCCISCGRRYKNRGGLLQHIRLECGKEPMFQCPVCLQKSHQKGTLKKHIKRYHPHIPIT